MSDVYVYMYKHASMQDKGDLGPCSSRKFLEIRCSEIASEAIWRQKQRRNSYMDRGILHPIFGCPCVPNLLSQLNSRWGEIARRP